MTFSSNNDKIMPALVPICLVPDDKDFDYEKAAKIINNSYDVSNILEFVTALGTEPVDIEDYAHLSLLAAHWSCKYAEVCKILEGQPLEEGLDSGWLEPTIWVGDNVKINGVLVGSLEVNKWLREKLTSLTYHGEANENE